MAAIVRCAVWTALLSVGFASLADQSCSSADACSAAEGARQGGALLQSQTSTQSVHIHGDAPLQGRITTALAEVASLQDRIEGIMSVVGVSESEAVPVAAMQKGEADGNATKKIDANAIKKIDTSALYARYKELLETKKEDEAALKDDVAALEADCFALRSNILLLENQVQGSSLLAKGVGSLGQLLAKGADNPTSLASRVEAVEKDIEDFRTRVTSLEQVVSGLQTKASLAAKKSKSKSKSKHASHKSKAKKEASLLAVGATAKSKTQTGLGPLSARLTALEKEVESLQQRSETLETEIQGGGTGLISEMDLATPVQKPHRYASLLEQGATKANVGEGTIKERTSALETSVAALKSKMSMLENEAVGRTSTGGAPSLLQVSGSGESLKARISSLEDEVDSLRTRVTTLEHVVQG